MADKVGKVRLDFIVNGQEQQLLCEPRQTLLEILREELQMTGTKEGCADGNCGACSVILDGTLVDSCLVLGVEAEGKTVETVEGVATTDGLHPIQQSFLEEAALQCGICTPGFIMSTKALLEKDNNPSEHKVREWVAGNLCRCTGYDKIIRAILSAAKKIRESN